MGNEERIKAWRGKRHEQALADAIPAIPGSPDHAATADLRQGTRVRGLSRGTADEADLDDVRQAILGSRDARWRKSLSRAMALLVIPSLAVLLYGALVATPLYEGDAVFTVQTSGTSAPAPGAGIFALTSGGSTISDAFKAREYILSRPMMEQMQQRHGFLTHFAGPETDPITRFESPFGLNRDPLVYYQRRVTVSVDVQEGILRLNVQARSQQDAIRFGNALLSAAEQHVNQFSKRIGEDQIASLTNDVRLAEMGVAETRRSLASVQAQRGDVSPQQTASAVYQLISNLELQMAEAESQRDSLRAEGLVNSPLLPGLEAKVRELRSQVVQQRKRLISPDGGSLARTLDQYEGASVRKEIAQARWEAALRTLQQAYLQVLQERRYFVIVVGMSVGSVAAVRDWMPIAGPILLLLALIYGVLFVGRSLWPNRSRRKARLAS